MDIEQECFEFPWLEADFIRCLSQRNCVGMVAEQYDSTLKSGENGDPIGFTIFEKHQTRIHVLNFAVSPEFRRQGVGRQLVNWLDTQLSSRSNRILLEIRETNLEAQLFFKNTKFRAVSILRNYYDDSTEDAYLMQYRKIQQEALAGSA